MPRHPAPNQIDDPHRLAATMGIEPHPGPSAPAAARTPRVNFGLGDRYSTIAHRVGGLDAEARFTWLLTFAQLSADQFNDPGTVIELREQLIAFALLQGIRGDAISTAMQRLDAATILQLRITLETGLVSLTRVGGDWAPEAPGVQRRFRRQPDGSISTHFEKNDIVDALLWNVGDLLQTHGVRLALCARPTCGRLFVRHKRGAYCSLRCSQKVRTHRMRANLSETARDTRQRTPKRSSPTQHGKSPQRKRPKR